MDAIEDAAAPLFTAGGECHVYVMIANCCASGGAAWVDDRLVIVTRARTDPAAASWALPDEPYRLALHEMGHVIAGLAEEYITCLPWSAYQTESYPNLVHQAQIDAAWWRTIAPPYALNGDQLKVRHHRTGQGACSGEHNVYDHAAVAEWDTLGLYWGAQFLEIESMDACEAGYDSWADPRSGKFFRPRAFCRMRDAWFGFCPACEDTIASIVRDPYPAEVPLP
jgi:hypothetical protein